MTLFNKITQLMPFLKHGIISSVQPFPCPFPHGFSTDVLTQGGNSGSPVFLADNPVVLGIHKGVVPGGDNMTITVPSHLIAKALEQFLATHLEVVSAFQSMEDMLKKQPWEGALRWERLA